MRVISFKTLAVSLLALLTVSTVSAQDKKKNIFGLANRVGIGVGVGTEGIGIDAAIPLTQYVQVRAGLNIFPNIKFHENVELETDATVNGGMYTGEDEVRINCAFGRTYGDLKFDVYPFGNKFNLFITAGLSFGGADLLKLSGHSDVAQDLKNNGYQVGVNVADRNIEFDENGDIKAGVKVNKVRPYLGLGFGRLIPKNRIGFRFEVGAQFQGKPKVYAGDVDNILDDALDSAGEDMKDDISTIMDWLKVYPVLKFSIRGRIL